MFLTPCHGLQEWREWAQGNIDSALFDSVSTLPDVKCKVSAGMDGSGVPLGICDRCYFRNKRFKPCGAARAAGAGCRRAQASLVAPLLQPAAPTASRDRGLGADSAAHKTTTPIDGECQACCALRERLSYLERALERATYWAALVTCKAADLRVRLLTALVVCAGAPAQPQTCTSFLEALHRRAWLSDRDGPVLQAVANSLFVRGGTPPEIRVPLANGRETVYKRKVTPRKTFVQRSQMYKSLANGLNLLTDAFGAKFSGAVTAGSINVNIGSDGCPVGSRLAPFAPITASPKQQLGLILWYGVSPTAFNGVRMGLDGSRVGLASVPALRACCERLARLPAKRVIVTSSGAHLVDVKAAAQEKLAALSASNSFVERLLLDENLQPILQTVEYEPRPTDDAQRRRSPCERERCTSDPRGGQRGLTQLGEDRFGGHQTAPAAKVGEHYPGGGVPGDDGQVRGGVSDAGDAPRARSAARARGRGRRRRAACSAAIPLWGLRYARCTGTRGRVPQCTPQLPENKFPKRG